MRRFSLAAAGMGLVFLSGVVTGCASEEGDSSSGYVRPKVSEPVAIDASEQTRADLGVVVWGADGADGTVRIAGYDAGGQVVMRVEQRTVIVDDKHHWFETKLSRNGVDTIMKLEGSVGTIDEAGNFDIDLRMAENAFEGSPESQHALDRLKEDLEGGTASAPSLIGSGSVTTRDQQLVDRSCTELLKGCGSSVVRAAAPLLPCAGLGWNILVVLRCALVGGAAAGPGGALAGGAVCAIQNGNQIVKNAAVCAARAEDIYKNFGSRANDVMTSCSEVKQGCGGGSDVPMASFDPTR